MFKYELSVWVAIVGAAAVKLVTSPYQSVVKSIVTAFIAMFCAIVFTAPLVAYINFDPDTWHIPVAALLALTGEGLVRTVIAFSNNPKEFLEMLKIWRGKK